MKTAELTGAALDWAVAKCEGALAPLGNVQMVDSQWLLICVGGDPNHGDSRVYFNPSTDWSQGGPIVEREAITLRCNTVTKGPWVAFLDTGGSHNAVSCRQIGPAPLIAAMRTYVASKLGDEVEVPEEVLRRVA